MDKMHHVSSELPLCGKDGGHLVFVSCDGGKDVPFCMQSHDGPVSKCIHYVQLCQFETQQLHRLIKIYTQRQGKMSLSVLILKS